MKKLPSAAANVDKRGLTADINAVAYYDLIKKNHYAYVILAQIWENYGSSVITSLADENSPELSKIRVSDSMRKALRVIIESGATPVIVKATHIMPAKVNECLTQSLKTRGLLGGKSMSEACSNTPVGQDGNSWFDQLFVDLRSEFPNLIVVDPKVIQCDGVNCVTTIDGVPVYRDVGHITDYASYRFGAEYLKQFGNPFQR